MSDIYFKPFKQQKAVLRSKARIKGCFAGKRGGKSEILYIDDIIKAENKSGWQWNGRDKYLIGLIAPTQSMLSRLVWPKLLEFAKPFISVDRDFKKQESVLNFGEHAQILGFSAEKITRMEGFKLNHVHMIECFQQSQHVFLEALARLSDSKGTLTLDGSLGPNIINPKSTWVYKMFKEQEFDGAEVFEWSTKDNPYFPEDELVRMKNTLDMKTYQAMFEMVWDVMPEAAVYNDFSDVNIVKEYVWNPAYETYISIDWGWAHPMAVGFYQWDKRNDVVYKFDEIHRSRIKIPELWNMIQARLTANHVTKIHGWCCDVAGNQEREQTGQSNIAWFWDNHRIKLKSMRTAIQYGIPIVRSYIKDANGATRFFVNETKCPKTVDEFRTYRYPEKDGVIQNENPVKENDDAMDETRYFFVNFLDKRFNKKLVIKMQGT